MARTVFVADDERSAREYAFGADSPYRFYYEQLGSKLIRAGRAPELARRSMELMATEVAPALGGRSEALRSV